MSKGDLLKSLNELRNCVRLLLSYSRDRLVVWRLALRIALGGVFRDLAGLDLRSFKCGRFNRRLAFSARTMAAGTLLFVEGRAIFCRKRNHR